MKSYNKINTSTKNKKDEAYSKILQDIKTCTLYPGMHISMNELSSLYDLGISPIRDALQRLIADGFVVSVPRFGYIITPVTLNDFRELMEIRLIIETAAVLYAIQRGTDSQVQKILDAADFSYTHGDRNSYINFIQKNSKFHSLISEISGNHRFNQMQTDINTQLERVFYLGLDLEESGENARLEHIKIARAIKDRDKSLAQELIKKHIVVFEARVTLGLSSLTDGTG